MLTIFHANKLWNRPFWVLLLLGMGHLIRPGAALADPTPSFDQIYVKDEGTSIVVSWRFYYKLLPSHFILKEKNSALISLEAPMTLKQNLTDLASVAFLLTVEGQEVSPVQVPGVALSPDGRCTVTLLFPGQKSGRLEFRDRALAHYPPSYVINYQIYSPLNPASVDSGYLTGGQSETTIKYTQLAADYHPSLYDWLSSPPVKLFEAELRIAWINTNLLFTALILLMLRPGKEILELFYGLAASWLLPCCIWVLVGLQIPFPLHPIIPAVFTVGICVVCQRGNLTFPMLMVLIVVAGLLNGCFDIQQTSLMRPAPETANIVGLALGFLTSLGLVFCTGFLIVSECRRNPEFQVAWAPKICWFLAGLTLVLPWLKTQ